MGLIIFCYYNYWLIIFRV